MSTAIKDLAEGSYPVTSSLTYGNTTITGGTTSGNTGVTPGGYTINTDIKGRKYLTIANGEGFGKFEVGASSYTVAFVFSTKDLDNPYIITLGFVPKNEINFATTTQSNRHIQYGLSCNQPSKF